MSKIVDKYKLDVVIGSGQFGKVFKAIDLQTNQCYAIKAIKNQVFEANPKLEQFVVNEIRTLSKIKNQNVVKFIEMITTLNHKYFVYEFCNGGTLEEAIYSRGYYLESEAIDIFKQIVNGLNCVVQMNIIHRDLKPQNILFHDGFVKIADFGFCKQLSSRKDLSKTILGSPIYMAPEILLGEEYTMKADIWSLGVMLYEMLFGKCPFEGKNIAQLIDLIHENDMKFPEEYKISEKTKNLIRKMLCKDANKRIEWEEICQGFSLEKKIQTSHFLTRANTVSHSQEEENNQKSNKNVNPSMRFINTSHKINNSEHFISLPKIKLENEATSHNSSFTHSSQGPEIHYYTPSHIKSDENKFHYTLSKDVTPSASNFSKFSKVPQEISQNFEEKQKNIISQNNYEASPLSASFREKSAFSISYSGDYYVKINLKEPIVDKEGFLLFLNKEIMKIYYLAQVFSNIHAYQLETEFKFFELMFLKYLMFFTKKIKESLLDKIDYEITLKIANVLEFIKLPEYRLFEKEVTNQLEKITSLYSLQKVQFLSKTLNNPEEQELYNDNFFNFRKFFLTLVKYIENIKTDYLFSKREVYTSADSVKYVIFLNELIDSILLEELFDKFIKENCNLNGQKYFEDIRKSPIDSIFKLVSQKIEYAKEKFKL